MSAPDPGGDAGPTLSAASFPSALRWNSFASRPRTCCATPGAETRERSRASRRASAAHTTPASLLAHAQLAIAREYGFPSWPKLVHHVESVTGGGSCCAR